MSWLKDLLESTSKITDPFLKFLLRLTYLLLLIVAGFLAYSLITKKIIKWGSKDYGVVDPNYHLPNDSDSSKSIKKQLHHIDSNLKDQKAVKVETHKSTKMQIDTAFEQKNKLLKSFYPQKLTLQQKEKVIQIIDDVIKENPIESGKAGPNNYDINYITIWYILKSKAVAQNLSEYLVSKNYKTGPIERNFTEPYRTGIIITGEVDDVNDKKERVIYINIASLKNGIPIKNGHRSH